MSVTLLRGGKSAQSCVLYIGVAVIALFVALPVLWGVMTSLKTEVMSVAYPPTFLPSPVVLSNYLVVLSSQDFGTQLWNSALYSVASVVLAILVAAPAGYAASRLSFRGKRVIMLAIMCAAMIPNVALLVPTYYILNTIGLLNNKGVVNVIFAAQLAPQTVWFIRNFIDDVPVEIEEAAFVDGATRIQAFVRIVLPLIRPGVAAVFVLGMITVWNDYIVVSAFAPDLGSRTLQVALVTQVFDTAGLSWSYVMSFAIITSLPPVLIFLAAQRWFVAGLTAGSVKG